MCHPANAQCQTRVLVVHAATGSRQGAEKLAAAAGAPCQAHVLDVQAAQGHKPHNVTRTTRSLPGHRSAAWGMHVCAVWLGAASPVAKLGACGGVLGQV
jgi:hypothetical protein